MTKRLIQLIKIEESTKRSWVKPYIENWFSLKVINILDIYAIVR